MLKSKQFLLVFFMIPALFIADLHAEEEVSCSFTREYITTLEYLRAHSELALKESAAQKLARQVSQGCTGSAQRFAKVASTLNRAGVFGQNAIDLALEFAPRTDLETEVFISVFLKSYLEEYLNLDLNTSLKLARGLTLDLPGMSSDKTQEDLIRDFSLVQNDFEKLVHFCMDENQVNLPRPQCAIFSMRIIQKNGAFKKGVADSFLKLFAFLTSNSGPGLTTGKSLEIAERLLLAGELAADNFISAYKYAASSSGLKLDMTEAFRFAQDLTTSKPESRAIASIKRKSHTLKQK